MAAILSVNALSWLLGIPVERLREVASNINKHYRKFPQQTGPDKIRILRVPDAELKDIQRRIKKRVLDPISIGDYVHGGVRGRSPRSNAQAHCGAECVITLDVRKFFDKGRHAAVYRLLRHELGFGRDVANILTRLTTLNACLPQGAPTSTSLANLVLSTPVDGQLTKELTQSKIRYTRFVDDLAFSGGNPRSAINMAAKYLSQRRLKIHRKNTNPHKKSKLRITPRSRPQEVTGLLVNASTGPSISRKRRDGIREAIFLLRYVKGNAATNANVRSIRGRITHLRQFNPGSALRLERYLDATIQG